MIETKLIDYSGWETGGNMNTSGPGIPQREKVELLSDKVERCAVLFESDGETLHCWLYLPRIRLPGVDCPEL